MNFKLGLIILIILALIGGGTYFYSTKNKNVNNSSKHDQHNHQTYTCPMHPQIKSDKPGSCPICGMDLVLVDKGENKPSEATNKDMETPQGHVEVNLPAFKQQLIGVQITKAVKKHLFKSVRSPGRVAFDPELYTTQSEYLEGLKQWEKIKTSPISAVRENTRQMIKSSRIRLKVLGLSDGQIEDLTKKGSQSEGLLVGGKGEENWVYADIFEMDLPYIKKGNSAKITANFLQGKTLAGEVLSVDQVINPENRTAKVRIKLINNEISIRPESYVNVTIFSPLGEHISVPIEAIMDTGRETYVFIKKGEGQFLPKIVQVSFQTDKDAAILSGLNEGEEVVIGANFMLDSESRLKSVLQGETSGGQHDHP